MPSQVYVTTTIPYVNARPHIGFALELLQADVLARYHRLRGADVRFQSGTDDNAMSNVLSARAADIPVADFVESNSTAFRDLCETLDISVDRFVRTSDPLHHAAVRNFLSRLRDDDTYQASYRGLYCPRCEDFVLERDAQDGRCPEHRTALDLVDEENHFFRLSRYQEALADLIKSRRLEIVPASREKEVLRFIESGLRDFSISRSSARAGGWGVPFPDDPDQVVYVWVDALVNYLTGLGFGNGERSLGFWSGPGDRVHVIGKNVWKFHAIYWPALLLSAGLELPTRIFAHGFLTEGGRKISKTAGNTTDPEDYVSAFTADAVRYYLLAHTRPYEDTDVSIDRLESVHRADLANTLGNLCSRLTALCESAGVAGVQAASPQPPGGYHDHLQRFRFDLAAGAIWDELHRLNREIAEERPWDALSPGATPAVADRLRIWAEQLAGLAVWLGPLLPATAEKIGAALRSPRIRKCAPLFPRAR